MLLRPTVDSDQLVIGPCYVNGLVYGEAVLGPFPPTIRPRRLLGTGYIGFEDIETGARTRLDPRLQCLGVDLTQHREQLEDFPYLFVDPEELRLVLQHRGVKLELVDLV